MYVPKFWARSSTLQAGGPKTFRLQTWGWSDQSVEDALERAEQRLHALGERASVDPGCARAWEYYSNGERPVREQIVDAAPAGAEGRAVITRNRYGALVLNTARLMFIDIDLPPPVSAVRSRGLFGLFGRKGPVRESVDERLGRLKVALASHSAATFRIYRTAAGFRALAVNRDFDPAGPEAQRLLVAVQADPMFIKLCNAQRSFRARLTPKPWRCGAPPPPHSYPFQTSANENDFVQWQKQYEACAGAYGTCKYLETLGPASASIAHAKLIDLHDRVTRAHEAVALA